MEIYLGRLQVALLLLTLLLPSSIALSCRKSHCSSWRLNVEVNNVRDWSLVPSDCETYVASYITGHLYRLDSEETVKQAIAYARGYSVSADGNYIWVFDIDETSLSNAPYYADHNFGAEAYNSTAFNAWVEKAEAPPLLATLRLYGELLNLSYGVFFLTGRDEDQRNVTVENLQSAGYSGWEGLILRQPEDQDVDAVIYKSQRRKALEDIGYTIVGNVGDQWSDITGYSVGDRVFKLPNPMYYIP